MENLVDMSHLSEKIFTLSPRGSDLWIKGYTPEKRDDFGVSYGNGISVVPFIPYEFALRDGLLKSKKFFKEVIVEGTLNKIDRFTYAKDLTEVIEKGTKISLFLEVVNSTLIWGKDKESICLPYRNIKLISF